MTETTTQLPHWDMHVVFPGLESDAFKDEFAAVLESIDELEAAFDQHQIGLAPEGEASAAAAATLDLILEQFNKTVERVETVNAYIYSFVAVDSTDEMAQARLSELEQKLATVSLLATRLTAWLGSLDVEGLIQRSDGAKQHAFALRRARVEAEHLMSPEKEALASKLVLTGSSAWSRLHGDVASQLVVHMELEGERQELPMSAVRNLAYHADREVRQAGYKAELEKWEAWRVPLAAALNGIKGEVNVLSQERGWASPLAATLFQNNMDQATLEAMLQAGRESFPDFRRYLKAKAKALDIPQMAFYDIFAPMESGGMNWSYRGANEFIVQHFGEFSERMQGLAQRAFKENWIDAEPRAGKRDGAFCMHLRRDESRIMANFTPSYDGMSTLAHELGHAYHNLNLDGKTPLQRETPMTLAETASTFCQTLIQKKALEASDEAGQLYILEAAIQDACQIVVDISSRLQFEQAVFEGRQARPLSADEFCELMLQAQADTYGEGLNPAERHPYMWAVKPHYYSGGRSYYNYPYMFGLLFGLGLYARFQDDPDAFREGYDELLSMTGMADAASLAGRFGFDLSTPAFWRASLDVVREDIDRFEALVG